MEGSFDRYVGIGADRSVDDQREGGKVDLFLGSVISDVGRVNGFRCKK